MNGNFKKLSLILMLLLTCGSLFAANWKPSGAGTYTLTSTGSGNKFYVDGGTTAYDGIAAFTLSSGETINLVFNTSKPVNVNGMIEVTKGILNLSIGTGYSGDHSTLIRGTRSGDLIRVQNSTTTQNSCKLTITGNGTNEFMIHGNSTFTVTGTDADGYSVTAAADQKHDGVLVDFYGGVLTMDYVKLCNNYNVSSDTENNLRYGSAIRHYQKSDDAQSKGIITLTNCTIQDCCSENAGTALVLRNNVKAKKTTVTMTNCKITGCFCEATGSSNGGIIRTWASSFCTLKMEKCAIKNNKSNTNSCIAWNAVQTDPIQLIDDTISGNWTSGKGGGVWICGLGIINGCVIADNYCKGTGGGLCYTVYTAQAAISGFSPNNGTLTLDANTTISGNTAKGNGGGIFFQVNPLNIGKTTYYRNSAGGQYECSLVIDGATITGNKSLADGGGIYLKRTTDIYKSNLEVKAGNIKDNQSGASGEKDGGGIYISSTTDDDTYGTFPSDFMRTDLNIIFGESAKSAGDLTVTGNKANNGGGAYITGEKLNTEIYNGTFGTAEKPNLASTNGGGFYVNNGNVEIAGGIIKDNVATTGNGGGFYVTGSNVSVTVAGGTIQNNTAGTSGGGIYASAPITLSGTSTITNNTAVTSGGGIYAGGTISLGAGNFTVGQNTVGSLQNNIYLLNDKTIKIAVSSGVNPEHVGIFTQNDAAGIAVLSADDAEYLTPIYNGLVNGTMKIFDDRQKYSIGKGSNSKRLYFIDNPWTPLQRSITGPPSQSDDVYQIGNAKDLTAYLALVNKISIGTFNPVDATPEASARLTADIDMAGQYWVPITNFTGTFDGGGHTISGLSMTSGNESTGRGLFGKVAANAVIKNLVFNNFNLEASTTGCVGGIAAEMAGGNVLNCMASGTITATSDVTAVGGLVGQNSAGTIENCYCKVSFNDEGTNGGGLVGINGSNGTVSHCYVRTVEGSLPKYLLAYSNNGSTGSISYCYASNVDKELVGIGTTTNCGKFTPTLGTPYIYRQKDNLLEDDKTPLKDALNSRINSGSGLTKGTYARWERPATDGINGDYPILMYEGCNAVAEDAGGILHYGNVNTLLKDESNYNAVWFYGSEPYFEPYSGNKLFIDEDAALKQTESAKAGTITATVGITLDNSAGEQGANPTQGGTTDAIDWHFFSTSLSDAPLGIDYDDQQYSYNDPDMPQYGHTGEGYFPTRVNDYYNEWDFYAYYESEYLWVNYKRNSASHYNPNPNPYGSPNNPVPITYSNEATLIPGKGYMVALADPDGTLLQCTGTLNNGDVEISLSCAGDYRTGLNLLGNPYQSYLDFVEFANTNSSIWSDETTPYYIIIDEDKQGYVAFAVEQSKNTMTAGCYIHPHQGFMVVTSGAITASFDNGMRVPDVGDYDAHFRSQRLDYPLVNLIATDANGNRDIATAELGRPDKGGAILADLTTLANCLVYVHYDDKDYRIAFTQPGINSLPVRFEAFEAGTFTLTWDMENGEFSYMHLIDNITGADVDMLTASEYSFTASPDDLRSRFKLVFDYTGIEEDGNAVANANFAYMSNGQLVVEGEGLLQVIDVNGRVLHQARLNGSANAVKLPEMASGLYVLKLNGMTQKIVL